MITFEVPGAVVRMAKQSPKDWTPEQRAVIDSAKVATFVYRKHPGETVRSMVDGRVIAVFAETEYVLAMCVMKPDQFRYETDDDVEEWKKKFPNHKQVSHP